MHVGEDANVSSSLRPILTLSSPSEGQKIRVKFEKKITVMSVAEMKVALINRITNLNDETLLQQVLALLEKAEVKEASDTDLSKNYDAIKEQYGDVLQKLAQ